MRCSRLWMRKIFTMMHHFGFYDFFILCLRYRRRVFRVGSHPAHYCRSDYFSSLPDAVLPTPTKNFRLVLSRTSAAGSNTNHHIFIKTTFFYRFRDFPYIPIYEHWRNKGQGNLGILTENNSKKALPQFI